MRYPARFPLIALVLLAVGGFVPTVAARASVPDRPVTLYTNDTAAMAPGGAATRLEQRVRAKGRLRVIIGLRMQMRMKHTLAVLEAAQQERSLDTLQTAVAMRVLGRSTGQDIRRYWAIPYLSMFVNAAQLRRLVADPQVVSIEEEIMLRPQLRDSVPLIHADEVWPSATGQGALIAIVDTGIDKSHPMLKGKVALEACFGTNDGTRSSYCPNGASAAFGPGTGVPCPDLPACGHGTHIASIAGGNSSNLSGVAKGAKIIAVQVATKVTSAAVCSPADPPCVRIGMDDLMQGLQHVLGLRTSARVRIAAANISLAEEPLSNGPCDSDHSGLAMLFGQFQSKSVNIAPVVAAGNQRSRQKLAAPACLSKAIAVGNTHTDDVLNRSSNHTRLIDLLAPGTGILAAFPNNRTAQATGTSQAAAHVSGAFSLLRSANHDATVPQILEHLACTGKVITHESGALNSDPLDWPRPRIDVFAAFDRMVNPTDGMRQWFFNTTSDVDDWTEFRGIWAAQAGKYTHTDDITGWVGSSVANNCETSFEATARLRLFSPVRDTSRAGLLFKARPNYREGGPFPADVKRISGYMAYFWFPNFLGGNQAYVGIYDVINMPAELDPESLGGFIKLCGPVIVDINLNKFNVLKVVSQGISHSVSINGAPVCSVDSSKYSDGVIMPVATFGQTGRTLEVDSVTIKRLPPADVNEAEMVLDPEAYGPGGALSDWADPRG